MATERLYYTDCYLTRFTATVREVRDRGGRNAVVLDRTAFYPTSGGQPFDTGTLSDVDVLDVIDEGDEVLHVMAAPLPDARVAGCVDWTRRFDHMQQHTGQHVLSAAFHSQAGVETVSFHLGSGASTIDLAREVSAHEITAAEDAANQIVWSNVPVAIRVVDAAEAASLPLRKESARAGPLRIVEVEGFDVSACGGTHVSRSGAVGVIAVSGWERFRGGTRLEFRCGVRALAGYRALRDVVSQAAKLLSAGAADVPSAIERGQADNKDLRRRLREAEERLAAHDVDALVAGAESVAGMKVVIARVATDDPAVLRAMAQAIAARPAHAAVLCGSSAAPPVAIARAAGAGLDCAKLLQGLKDAFGGRGGGRPELAQGGGLSAPADEILARARELAGLPPR